MLKNSRHLILSCLALLLAGWVSASAFASGEVGPVPPEVQMASPDEPSTTPGRIPTSAVHAATQSGAAPASTRTKNLDFESNVIEGMNRDPLDVAEHLGKKDVGAEGHLYRKRLEFNRETARTVQEMGVGP